MGKLLLTVLVLAAIFGAFSSCNAAKRTQAVAEACAPIAERGIYARQLAMQEEYTFNEEYQCVYRLSHARVQQQRAPWEAARQQRENTARIRKLTVARVEQPAPADTSKPNLAEARLGFTTRVAKLNESPQPLPQPPTELFVHAEARVRFSKAKPLAAPSTIPRQQWVEVLVFPCSQTPSCHAVT